MIFIPIGTDRQQRHLPWVNYGLILANVVIHLTRGPLENPSISQYILDPMEPDVVQFFSYQFLHAAGLGHLLFNMVSLYVFGNVLEDKLGSVSYLAFYLAGGVTAGLGHCLFQEAPVLGASGSVAAVTGCFLALLPKCNVKIFYWFMFYMDTFEVTGMVLVIYQIILNMVMFGLGAGGVAYLTHLSGYGFGFAVGMGLLYTRLIPREPFDLLSLIEHRRRRQQFRALAKKGYQPWMAKQEGAFQAKGDNQMLSQAQEQILEYRHLITDALEKENVSEASDHYEQLLDLDDRQILNQDGQLEVANHLMSTKRYELAAKAYELFLDAYKSYNQKEQIELILGLIYARYLERPDRARELLNKAIAILRDEGQLTMARQALGKLGPST